MEGFTMSHKKSAHRIAIEEEHPFHSGTDNGGPAKATGAPPAEWYQKEGVLAAKAIGLF